MSVRLYMTIAAIVAILYALAFLIIPIQTSLFFSNFAEARAIVYLRFCGASVLAWGLILWFARDFEERRAVRGVLIGTIVGIAVNLIITIWATLAGWLNTNSWGTAIVLALLLVGAIYQISVGKRPSPNSGA